MYKQRFANSYVIAVIVAGSLCVAAALFGLPRERINLEMIILATLTVGFGSRVSVPIPRFKSHISVSDTFIFLALLLYGGEVAILLSGAEAIFSSWRFCNRKLTVFFNGAACAFSTTCVIGVLSLTGVNYSDAHALGSGADYQNIVVALSAIAFTQYFMNTILASIFDSLTNELPLFETWKNKYLWTFITYSVGALGAGFLVQLSEKFGFAVILAVFPIVAFVYLTYSMYLRTVEMSISQAEIANEYAAVLEERSAALRESEQRFRSAFNYAPIGIGLASAEGSWLKVNQALCDILGYDADELLEQSFRDMIERSDLVTATSRINTLLSGQITNCQSEQRCLHKDGRIVWTSWSVSTVGEPTSGNANLIFQIQDITDRKLTEQKLRHEATHDSLTGLPNRAYFMTRLTEALQQRHRDANHGVSVLFIDLDRFKHVNDSLGHLIGDGLLIAISKRLQDCVRPADTVARMGGDEFTLLVEGKRDAGEIVRIAERIQQKFNVPFEIESNEIYSSASIGILHASELHKTAEEMMRDADTAMYRAKRAGKARHEVFDQEMYAEAKETLMLETDLRRAVEKDELKVYYQPIVSLATGEIRGVEALARWEHPEFGDIPPSKFIPLAEEIGRIDALGENILRRACVDIGAVYREVPDCEFLKLSVNLSPRQFANPLLDKNVLNILFDTEFPVASLRLEITESVFFEYQERALDILNKFRNEGISIDIDDFGTGYSNMSYLVRLPISTLKIDRSFVAAITSDGANTEIVQMIVALAKNLGLRITAEGIETEAQLESLKKLKCDEGQGFYFATPMTADEFRDYLLDRKIGPIHIDNIEMIDHVQ